MTIPPRPPIVCLCGSTRFFRQFQESSLTETVAGKIVLSIGCNLRSDHQLWADPSERDAIKIRLDELHKRKIEMADEVLVLNVGGYIGDSTRSEIEHALKLGKPIRYLEGANASEGSGVAAADTGAACPGPCVAAADTGTGSGQERPVEQ